MKSSGELVAATHTNRKATSRHAGPAARSALKEAGSELASRRTGSAPSISSWRAADMRRPGQGERAKDREALATKGPTKHAA